VASAGDIGVEAEEPVVAAGVATEERLRDFERARGYRP